MTAAPIIRQVPLVLGGRRFLLQPRFAALAETERRTGLGLVALARRFAEGRYGLGDAVALLHPALADEAGLDEAAFGALVVDAGLVAVAPACAGLLALALAPREGLPNPL